MREKERGRGVKWLISVADLAFLQSKESLWGGLYVVSTF